MSKCTNCLSEKVCRYNDGHNLYCKDDYVCPHFTDRSEWVHLPCKVGDTVCVYEYDGEVTEYCIQGPCPNFKTVKQIKAEAYKEFAEKALKN